MGGPRPRRRELDSDEGGGSTPTSPKNKKSKTEHEENSTHRQATSSNNGFSTLNPNVENPEANTLGSPNRSSRPPPISVFGVSILDLKSKISDKITGVDTKTLKFRITDTSIKVYTQSNEDHAVVRNFCYNTLKLDCFTHSYDDNRKIKYCLYGLPLVDCTQLKTVLRTEHNLNTSDVKILKPKNQQFKSNDIMKKRIYIIYFLKKDKIKLEQLRKVREISDCYVRWEHFVNRGDLPTQCSRCQDFGHGTEHCNRKYRCVRCGKGHKSDDCDLLPVPPLPADEDDGNTDNQESFKPSIPKEKICCANCGENHTANYGGCSYRKSIMSWRKDQKKNATKINSRPNFNIRSETQFPPPPPPGLPVGNNAWKQTNKVHSNYPIQPSISNQHPTTKDNDLFTWNECRLIMSELIERVRTCSSKAEQLNVIAEITFKYLDDGRQR